MDCFSFSFCSIYFVALLLIVLEIGLSKVVEALKLQNNKNVESIFLLKTTLGNDERISIGLDDELKRGFGNQYPEKYNSNSSFPFFYKLTNDTLFTQIVFKNCKSINL